MMVLQTQPLMTLEFIFTLQVARFQILIVFCVLLGSLKCQFSLLVEGRNHNTPNSLLTFIKTHYSLSKLQKMFPSAVLLKYIDEKAQILL